MRHTNKNKRSNSRRGASTVEFAVVAPLFFLFIFGCLDFGRLMLAESIIEQSAFEAARDVAVVGATVEEGEAVAQRELNILGIANATVQIRGLINGVPQPGIGLDADQVSATISVPMESVMSLDFLARGRAMERTIVIDTERFE